MDRTLAGELLIKKLVNLAEAVVGRWCKSYVVISLFDSALFVVEKKIAIWYSF